MTGLVIVAGIFWFFLAFATGNLAIPRTGSWWGGFLLAMILGPLGTAVVLLIPRRDL